MTARSTAKRYLGAIFVSMLPLTGSADGVAIDRVYTPYVQPLETEIELRSLIFTDDTIPDRRKYSVGVGRSLSERWSAEIYVFGSSTRDDDLDIDGYELELTWQLTEQGEYAFDWGMVFELERESDDDIWEASAAVLLARDLGRWTAVANAGVVYERGRVIGDEIEAELRLQARYRYRAIFEPALELHLAQDTRAVGPALTGLYRLSPGRKLHWEAGVFWALDGDTPERAFKFNLEYEFR